MQYLYLFFILFHLLFALLPLHLRAENIVRYSRKVLRRHPECKPQGFWDFITFRYCLRCPRANNITVFLYRANLAALCFLVPLAAAAVVFAAVPIDFDRALPGSLRWLPFFASGRFSRFWHFGVHRRRAAAWAEILSPALDPCRSGRGSHRHIDLYLM